MTVHQSNDRPSLLTFTALCHPLPQVYGAGNPCMVATLVGPPRTCAQVKTQLDAAVREAAGGAAGQGEAGAGQGEAAAGAGGDGGAEDGGNGNAALARVPARRKGRGKRVSGWGGVCVVRLLVVAEAAGAGPGPHSTDRLPRCCTEAPACTACLRGDKGRANVPLY